jgi:hypothetical protein
MADTAAYSGLRWGEIAALTVPQVDTAARVITVDRKVVEVAGHLYVEAPKNRKQRQAIYPRLAPAGYPLAEPGAVVGVVGEDVGAELRLADGLRGPLAHLLT